MDWEYDFENCVNRITAYIECSICGDEIPSGEKYYDFFGDAVCCDCADECKRTA